VGDALDRLKQKREREMISLSTTMVESYRRRTKSGMTVTVSRLTRSVSGMKDMELVVDFFTTNDRTHKAQVRNELRRRRIRVHPQITREMFSNPDTPRTRAVSAVEFQQIADRGRVKLESLRAKASPPTGLDKDWKKITDDAWEQTRESWGGATYDAHTGKALPQGVDAYALTVKPAGMDSVSVPTGASREAFEEAMNAARKKFAKELSYQQHYLGVFNDADSGRIDFDPVLVVNSRTDSEEIGAYTKNVGGAYNFSDGNGYWPPHVGP
jgi:hypothetical protein